MNQIASQGQLRLAFLRWALVTVPAIEFLGFLSGYLSNSGYENRWFYTLAKPDLMPPGWAFGVAWTILYFLMALALAMILHARGARGRGLAVGLFAAQFAFNLAWTPLFFGAHRVGAAVLVIVVMLVLSIVTTILFGRIRTVAAWLMVPYMVWISFAGLLTFGIGRLNPNAETLVPAARTSQML